MSAKFQLGQIVATPGALSALGESGEPAIKFLARHSLGDWGELDPEDVQANEHAILHEGDPDEQLRVLSRYTTSKSTVIWIITEWDRSVTTILLPSEY